MRTWTRRLVGQIMRMKRIKMKLLNILQTMTVMSEFLMMTEVTEVVIASAANQASTANCSCMISKICFWLEEKLIIMSKRTVLHDLLIQLFLSENIFML